MRFFVALWKGQQAARLLLAATNAASQREYPAALQHLQAAFDMGLPKHVEYVTLHGGLQLATGDVPAALETYKAAYALVDDTPDYNDHQRIYLKAYIADGASRAVQELPGEQALPPPDLTSLKTRRVSSLVRAMFPLPCLPASRST